MKSVKGFRPLKSIYTASHGVPTIPYVIDGSATLVEGSAVKLVGGANGIAPANATGDVVFGYVKSFVTKGQHPLQSVNDNSVYVDGTYTSAPTGDTYIADSTNPDSTGKQIMGLVVPAFGIICSAKMDDTVGTTTGSDIAGYYHSIATGDNGVSLDEDVNATSILQYLLTPANPGSRSAVDPFDSANRVFCTAVLTQQGVSTATTA